MGVFLRWGIFGILVVAALVYAYNAIGHLADRRRPAPATVVAPPAAAAETAATDAPPRVPARDERDAIPERCQVELDIARRAVESHSIGEPLDRLLRIQEIAWQKDEKLRDRYTRLATRWFNEPGPVDAVRLRHDVVAACVDTKP